MARIGNGAISKMAQRAARTGIKGQDVAPIAGVVAGVGSQIGNRPNVSHDGDNQKRNHIEEVKHRKNHHRGFPVITGRSEQPVNRR